MNKGPAQKQLDRVLEALSRTSQEVNDCLNRFQRDAERFERDAEDMKAKSSALQAAMSEFAPAVKAAAEEAVKDHGR